MSLKFKVCDYNRSAAVSETNNRYILICTEKLFKLAVSLLLRKGYTGYVGFILLKGMAGGKVIRLKLLGDERESGGSGGSRSRKSLRNSE